MSKWGIRVQSSEEEIRSVVEVVGQELLRQFTRGDVDPHLTNFVTKAYRALARKHGMKLANPAN